ncbi:hypothetical protein D3C86_1524610 [compost metagenome]
MMQQHVALQPDRAVARRRAANRHDDQVALLWRIDRHKPGPLEIIDVQALTVVPPIILAVEVHQLNAEHLPVVVAHQGVTVDHAVDEHPTFQRHLAGGRHLVPGRCAILQPDNPPSHAAGSVTGDVVQAWLGAGVRVGMNDNDDIAQILRCRVVFRVQDEVIRLLRLIATGHIRRLSTHADDQPHRFTRVLGASMCLGLGSAVVKQFAHG